MDQHLNHLRSLNRLPNESKIQRLFPVIALLILTSAAFAQKVEVRSATPNYMPAPVDSNSPAFWYDGQLHILNSANLPLLSTGSSQFFPMETTSVELNSQDHVPMWMEGAFLDENGVLFGYYHHEPGGICPELTAPRIGAAMSRDGGRTWMDLGIVLESGEVPDCTAKNGFFAGGYGDFSVAVDREQQYIYFYFTAYGGDVANQGIAVARLEYALRQTPVGNVWSRFEGGWSEPGLRGRITPVLGTVKAWQREDADSFWGPSLHYNHYLESWVMLLSHACCTTRWPQEGLYISYNDDITDPSGWSHPQLLVDDVGFGPGWYPQVLGTQIGETDKYAGQVVRLYVHGVSHWELVFTREAGTVAPPAVTPVEPTEPTVPIEPEDPEEPSESPGEPSPDGGI